MKNLKIQNFIWPFVIISILAWVIVLQISHIKIGISWNALKALQTVVAVDLLIWLFFYHIGWRLKIFQKWLVPFPVLCGTWKGKIVTAWTDPTSKKVPDPIEATLVIKQSFLTTSCIIYTKEMRSDSNASNFLIDPESGCVRLIYSYHSVPKASVRDRSAIHYGTAMLEFIKEGKKRVLKGSYWTDRKTTGDLEFEFYNKKYANDLST